jgi:hypothetical protein
MVYFERVLEGRLAEIKFKSMMRPLILVGLLSIFPWTNHTHLFSYQIPSFLCFLLISKLSVTEVKTNKLDLSFIFLGFVCAFTLEAYTAIVLIVLLFFLLVCYRKQASTIPSLAVILFNLVALLVMGFYSQRSAIKVIEPSQYFANLKDMILSPVFLASLLVLMALFALNLKVKARIGWLLVSIVASLLVCILISLVTNYNYFKFEIYPWSSILNIAYLSILVSFLILLSSLRSLIVGICFVFCSLIYGSYWVNNFLQHSVNAALYSNQLHFFYKNYPSSGDFRTFNYENAVKANSFVMQVRPLPTKDSPEWFIHSYEVMFKKYAIGNP